MPHPFNWQHVLEFAQFIGVVFCFFAASFFVALMISERFFHLIFLAIILTAVLICIGFV